MDKTSVNMFGEISVKYRNEKTYNGYTLDVMKSAVQKYIRRNIPLKAIYCGIDLDLFSFLKEGEKIRTNLIHRLMIIYLEDVSNVGLWNYLDKSIFKLLELRENRKNEETFSPKYCEIRRDEMKILPSVIYEMCISKHSRDNSFYKFCLYTYFKLEENIKNQIKNKFKWFGNIEKSIIAYNRSPEQKFSSEKLSKNVLNLANNFLSTLENKSDLSIYFAHKIADLEKVDEKFYRSNNSSYFIFFLINYVCPRIFKGENLEKYKKLIEIALRWYKELKNTKESFLCWQNLILIIIKPKEINFFEKSKLDLFWLYKLNIIEEKIDLDDYVYDMHTKIGKIKGKSGKHFAEESSMVVNEDESTNKLYKEAYTYFKILSDKSEETKSPEISPKSSPEIKNEVVISKYKESEFSKFIVRAQLVCSDSKTDTYFGEKDDKILFIKGPFKTKEEIDLFVKIQNYKKLLGLNIMNYQVVFMIPDNFPNTPLGIRKKLDKTKEYPFLVTESLFENKIPIKTHSSKLWPVTEVVDWDKVREFKHFDGLNESKDKNINYQYIKCIVFRYVFGIGDLAKRNFIVKGDKLYSIDEDSIDKDFSLEENLKINYGKFIKLLKEYKEILDDYKKINIKNNRLEKLYNLKNV